MTAELPRVKIIDPPVPLPVGVTLPPLLQFKGRGSREVRIPLYCDNAFRAMWKSYKLAFHQRGFCLRQHNGAWHLQQWLLGGPGNWTLTAVGAEQLANLTTPRQPAPPPMEVPVEFILPELPNGLEAKLFDYQRQPARQLYRALTNGKEEWGFPGAWDCSDLGTGKTYQSLAAAIATGLEVGVVCPKSVLRSWRDAFRHFGQQPAFIVNYESIRTGKREIVRKTGKEGRPFEWTLDPDHVMIVWDEAHNLKNRSLNRSMAMAAIRQGFKQLFVSGTMAAKPTNLAATGVAVGLHRGGRESYEAFLTAHGCWKVGETWEFDRHRGALHLAKIHRVVFPRRGARVKISDLGDRFPETQILCEAIETEDTKAIAKAYAEVKEMLARLAAQGKSAGEIEIAQRVAYMAVRKQSETAKVPALVDMAQAEIEEGRSVAIFLNFTEARERIMQLLKTDCAVFGGQDIRKRDAAIAKFQADESRVIVVMSAAGGTGVSLHDVHGVYPRTALICPDNNAVTLGQVLGRVHRAGGKSRSRQIIVYAADTVEESICDNVRQKLSAIQTVNDGDLKPEAKF